MVSGGKPCGSSPTRLDAARGQSEDAGRRDGQHHRDEHRGHLRQPPLQDEDQDDPRQADRGRGGHRLPVGDALDEAR